MNRVPEKLRKMGCKVKKKQCFTDYVSYLSNQYFVVFLEYGSCPVMPLLSSTVTVLLQKEHYRKRYLQKERYRKESLVPEGRRSYCWLRQ
jgi:hypothetical protein